MLTILPEICDELPSYVAIADCSIRIFMFESAVICKILLKYLDLYHRFSVHSVSLNYSHNFSITLEAQQNHCFYIIIPRNHPFVLEYFLIILVAYYS